MRTPLFWYFQVSIILFLIVGLHHSLTAQELLPKSSGEIIEHTYYTLSYNETHEQANWVYYILTDELAFGTVERTNDFRPDPLVSTVTAIKADYVGSGYDRGHMCPAEAMSFNLDAMSESFFFSNMSPQSGSLNRGKWKSLETKVRKWAKYKGEIHVVSGPIFKNNISVIGGNGVTVPGYYFKIIYNPENGMIAFVFPNEKANNSLDKYIVTVDWVEDMTGIDFFETMNDEDEALIEAKSDPSLWGLTGLVIMNAPVTVDNDDRCKAITKKGERCKRKRKEESDYCWQHNK